MKRSICGTLLLSCAAHACMTNSNYASFQNTDQPFGFADVVNVLYYVLGYLDTDPDVSSRIEKCADFDNDNEVTFTDFTNLLYLNIGYLALPAHFYSSKLFTVQSGWVEKDNALCTAVGGGEPLQSTVPVTGSSWTFSIDVRIPRAGNSGVFYFVQDGFGGVEYQVIDIEHPDSSNYYTTFGALYSYEGPSEYMGLGPGQWNRIKIVKKESLITHTLNDRHVLTYDLNNRQNMQSKSQWVGEMHLVDWQDAEDEGFIRLQHHGETDVCYRNADIGPKSGNLLIFSKTSGYRHGSIRKGIDTLHTALGSYFNLIDAHEDHREFDDMPPGYYKCIIFLSTTSDVLYEEQEKRFEEYMRGGGCYVGIHAAADTEYEWPFYMDMLGAKFAGHPAQQTATVMKMTDHYVTRHLKSTWVVYDEFYNYDKVPANKEILLQLNESTYEGGNMGAIHPIAWCSDATDNMGRMCYHGLGHRIDMFDNADFVETLKRMVLWGSYKN